MPQLLREAVQRAGDDDAVHVILLSGAGRAFCSGYDLKQFAETPGPNPGNQAMPWDPLLDYRYMSENTACFMRSLAKPETGRL